MPVPSPTEPTSGSEFMTRLAMQSAVFCCYLLVAIALLYSAWRISATSEMIDRIMTQQTSLLSQQATTLKEVKDARASIPDEVKEAIPSVVRNVAKDVAKDVVKDVFKK
jgi:hypothetical protein